MAYQTLYRRYRPRRFGDVRGQEHVMLALRNSVRDGRVGHAYLFSGPRGTGKTSSARILAKALNCENLQDGEPDGTCESCLAIDAGTSYDVQELDAASNNGVEAVRDLVGRAALGSPGRTKVYILDEVHMLTPMASAALLKTLEEPPSHVVFVLATTDPHKVLDTIRSRTQHFEFHLLPAEVLRAHVAWVIADAGLDVGEEAIEHVLRVGGGSARDTLSALDQVAAAGGAVSQVDAIDDLLDAVADADTGKALAAVAGAVARGRDPRVLAEQLLAHLRDVFLMRMKAELDHLPDAQIARTRVWAERLGDRATTRALEAVGAALLEMRQAPDPRIPLEVALVRLTLPAADTSIDGLVARVEQLERLIAAAAPSAAPGPSAPPPVGGAAGSSSADPAAGGGEPPPASSAPVAPVRPTGGATPSSTAGRAAGSASPLPEPAAPTGPLADLGPASTSSPQPAAGRPADAARAELAARRQRAAARPTPAVAAPPPRDSPPPPRAPSSPARRAASPTSPEPVPPQSAPAAPDPPASTEAPASPGAAPGGAAGAGEPFESAWANAVLPQLGGLARAMFSAGRLVETSDDEVVVAFPNEAHRQKCEQKRPDVERALAAHFAQPPRIRLVIDDSAAAGGGGERGGATRLGAQPPAADEDLGSDVHDLEDAPPAPEGVDALTAAFPGAELIDHDE